MKDFVELKGTSVFALGDSSALFMICDNKVLLAQTEAGFAEKMDRVTAGEACARPQTYELLAEICKGFEIVPRVVLITKYIRSDEVYFARIIYFMENELGKKILEIDARPSDALLQAAMFNAKVFIARSVLAAAPDASELLELARKRDNKSSQS